MNVDTESFQALTAEVAALREAVQEFTRMRILVEEIYSAGRRSALGSPAPAAASRPRHAGSGAQRASHLRPVGDEHGGGAA